MRVLLSLLIGLALGIGIGLYLGWVQFPIEVPDSPALALAQPYKDEYVLMIAAGYLADGDLDGVTRRLTAIGVDSPADYVRAVTERSIEESRSVSDLRTLVALAEAYNRLTPAMEPYRRISVPGQSS